VLTKYVRTHWQLRKIVKKLPEFTLWFSKTLHKGNLTKLSSVGMPTKSGKKKNEKTPRKRKAKGGDILATKQRIQVLKPDDDQTSIMQIADDYDQNITSPPAYNCICVGSSLPGAHVSIKPVGVSLSSGVNISHSTVHSVGPPLQFQLPGAPATPPTCHPEHSSPFPFTLKFIHNHVQKCQGCQLLFRQAGTTITPPHDLIVSRLERRPYRNATGQLTTPYNPSNAHYHLDMGCIKAADSTFVASSLVIPGSVMCQLTQAHKERF